MIAGLAAVVGSIVPVPSAAASANDAPTTPELVSPPSGATLSADSPQLFTIRASDPNGDPYSGWVTVANADGAVTTFPTTPAPSGEVSAGTPLSPLAPGSYTWTAWAADLPHGRRSSQPTPQPFSVGGAPDAGGGPFTGQIAYTPALPTVGGGCADTTLSMSATSAAAVVTFAPTAFAGFVNFTGSGASACELTTLGAGTLNLSAEGLGAAATTITCPELTGTYLRVGTDLRAVVSGACAINDREEDSVTFDIEAALIPPAGAGVVDPISEADLVGRFAIPPAT